MPNIGPVELIVVLLIVLVVVGPKKLPGLGRSLGTGMREFKDSVSGDKKHDELEEHHQASAPVAPPVQPPVAAPPVAPPAAPPVAPPLTKEPADQPAPPRDAE